MVLFLVSSLYMLTDVVLLLDIECQSILRNRKKNGSLYHSLRHEQLPLTNSNLRRAIYTSKICTAINKETAKPLWNLRFQRGVVRVAGLEPTVSWSQTAARTRCYRWEKLICRSLLLSAWSPAVLYPLYPGAPAVVVVKDVVPTESSRGAAPKPPHGSICIVTLMALKVKLFFPARRRSFPTCHCSARLRFAPVSERSRRIRFLAQVNICAA